MDSHDRSLALGESEIVIEKDDFTVDEFAIIELDDRLEFVNCCNANCNCGSGKGSG